MTDTIDSNLDSGVINNPAPQVIAPIKLEGVIPRGNNVPKPAPVDEPTDDTVENPELEVKADKEPVKSEKITYRGRTFNSVEELKKFADSKLTLAQRAQAKADKDLALLKQQLAKTVNPKPGTVPNKPTLPDVNPEFKEFMADVKDAYINLEQITDPKEKARNFTIIVGSLAQHFAKESEDRVLERLMQEIKPFKEKDEAQVKEQAEFAKSHKVFSTVADLQNEDGSPVFPQFKDEAKLDEIVTVWEMFKAEGTPDKVLYHPDFVILITKGLADGTIEAPDTKDIVTPKPEPKKKAAALSSINLPPNFSKGKSFGLPGEVLPGVMGRNRPSVF